MNEKIKTRLEIIKTGRNKYNISSPNPIDDEKIEQFKNEFKIVFEIECDELFIEFLKVSDGLEDSGYKVYSSYNQIVNKTEYGIFQNNELWHSEIEETKNYIFFAESGMEFFVFNKLKKQYECIGRDRIETTLEIFNSFDEMLLYILKLMLFEEIE